MRERTGRTAVVTGGASGIGLAMARRFAREGMKLVLADVEAPALDKAEAELSARGAEVIAVLCDVSDKRQLEAVADRALEAFSRIHVVCLIALETLGVYTATKYAVVGISEVLRQELAGDGIGVSVLCPFFVRTRIAESGRNRPGPLGGAFDAPENVQAFVKGGSDPAEIADRVLDAIVSDELYVLPHDVTRPMVEARVDANPVRLRSELPSQRVIEVAVDERVAIAAAADRVWPLLEDFSGLEVWWPAGMLEKVVCDGAGVGMVRHIHVGGLVLSEQLDRLVPAERRLELSITGDLPGSIADYHAWGRVNETGPERCEVEWHGRFRVDAAAEEPGARAFFQGAYATMFRGLQQATESR